MKRLIPLAVLALLAACGGDPPADDGRAASGEVLEGTISDAMLPVDRVRSQPPLADPEAAPTGGAPAPVEAAGEAEEPEAAPEDEPAAESED